MNKSILSFAVIPLLSFIAQAGFAAEATHVPSTALAAANADLIARADRALRNYVHACSIGDSDALARILTSDAEVEYQLEEWGTYLKIEADALIANCSNYTKSSGTGAHISRLWIFPTPDSNVVFVRYTVGSDIRSPVQVLDSGQLAIIEMRGDRIFKIRNSRKHS